MTTTPADRPDLTVVYSMTSSVDGYVADPDGDFGWSVPDDELFAFHTERVGSLSAYLCGRRLYEAMLGWEHDESLRSMPGGDAFADIWTALPKVVFSRTLTSVEGNARLATGTIDEELSRAPAGIVEVGGAELAGQCIQQDLVDEFHMFVAPVIVGGGTRYFAPRDGLLELELVDRRSLTGVEFLRYRRPR